MADPDDNPGNVGGHYEFTTWIVRGNETPVKYRWEWIRDDETSAYVNGSADRRGAFRMAWQLFRVAMRA